VIVIRASGLLEPLRVIHTLLKEGSKEEADTVVPTCFVISRKKSP
jgi:hypothetical protein